MDPFESYSGVKFDHLPLFCHKTGTCRGHIHLMRVNEESQPSCPATWPERILEIDPNVDLQSENYSLRLISDGGRPRTDKCDLAGCVVEPSEQQQIFDFYTQNEEGYSIWVVSNHIRFDWITTIQTCILAANNKLRMASKHPSEKQLKVVVLSIARQKIPLESRWQLPEMVSAVALIASFAATAQPLQQSRGSSAFSNNRSLVEYRLFENGAEHSPSAGGALRDTSQLQLSSSKRGGKELGDEELRVMADVVQLAQGMAEDTVRAVQDNRIIAQIAEYTDQVAQAIQQACTGVVTNPTPTPAVADSTGSVVASSESQNQTNTPIVDLADLGDFHPSEFDRALSGSEVHTSNETVCGSSAPTDNSAATSDLSLSEDAPGSAKNARIRQNHHLGENGQEAQRGACQPGPAHFGTTSEQALSEQGYEPTDVPLAAKNGTCEDYEPPPRNSKCWPDHYAPHVQDSQDHFKVESENKQLSGDDQTSTDMIDQTRPTDATDTYQGKSQIKEQADHTTTLRRSQSGPNSENELVDEVPCSSEALILPPDNVEANKQPALHIPSPLPRIPSLNNIARCADLTWAGVHDMAHNVLPAGAEERLVAKLVGEQQVREALKLVQDTQNNAYNADTGQLQSDSVITTLPPIVERNKRNEKRNQSTLAEQFGGHPLSQPHTPPVEPSLSTTSSHVTGAPVSEVSRASGVAIEIAPRTLPRVPSFSNVARCAGLTWSGVHDMIHNGVPSGAEERLTAKLVGEQQVREALNLSQRSTQNTANRTDVWSDSAVIVPVELNQSDHVSVVNLSDLGDIKPAELDAVLEESEIKQQNLENSPINVDHGDKAQRVEPVEHTADLPPPINEVMLESAPGTAPQHTGASTSSDDWRFPPRYSSVTTASGASHVATSSQRTHAPEIASYSDSEGENAAVHHVGALEDVAHYDAATWSGMHSMVRNFNATLDDATGPTANLALPMRRPQSGPNAEEQEEDIFWGESSPPAAPRSATSNESQQSRSEQKRLNAQEQHIVAQNQNTDDIITEKVNVESELSGRDLSFLSEEGLDVPYRPAVSVRGGEERSGEAADALRAPEVINLSDISRDSDACSSEDAIDSSNRGSSSNTDTNMTQPSFSNHATAGSSGSASQIVSGTATTASCVTSSGGDSGYEADCAAAVRAPITAFYCTEHERHTLSDFVNTAAQCSCVVHIHQRPSVSSSCSSGGEEAELQHSPDLQISDSNTSESGESGSEGESLLDGERLTPPGHTTGGDASDDEMSNAVQRLVARRHSSASAHREIAGIERDKADPGNDAVMVHCEDSAGADVLEEVVGLGARFQLPGSDDKYEREEGMLNTDIAAEITPETSDGDYSNASAASLTSERSPGCNVEENPTDQQQSGVKTDEADEADVEAESVVDAIDALLEEYDALLRHEKENRVGVVGTGKGASGDSEPIGRRRSSIDEEVSESRDQALDLVRRSLREGATDVNKRNGLLYLELYLLTWVLLVVIRVVRGAITLVLTVGVFLPLRVVRATLRWGHRAAGRAASLRW